MNLKQRFLKVTWCSFWGCEKPPGDSWWELRGVLMMKPAPLIGAENCIRCGQEVPADAEA